jgi:hypothetical protein
MRQFTQEEMREILQLASSEAKDAAGANSRFSLAEIQKAGGELGYDPARVEAAAQQVASRKQATHPFLHEYDSLLPGPMTAGAWEDVVMELRKSLRTPGAVRDRSDGGKEWIAASSEQTVSVTSFPAADGWHLALSYDAKHSQTIWRVFGFSLLVFFCMNAANSFAKRGPGSMDFVIAMFAISLEIIVALVGIELGKRYLRKKADRLATAIREAAIQSPSVPTQAVSQMDSAEIHIQA